MLGSLHIGVNIRSVQISSVQVHLLEIHDTPARVWDEAVQVSPKPPLPTAVECVYSGQINEQVLSILAQVFLMVVVDRPQWR